MSNDFLADMAEFLEFSPLQDLSSLCRRGRLDVVEDADRYAYRQGLFVLKSWAMVSCKSRMIRIFSPKILLSDTLPITKGLGYLNAFFRWPPIEINDGNKTEL
ncbi:MAG: hypothetical protein H6633_23870 [Anaerolineales bacterium]|nr:hypothetical protein [Anaerolineales bacterium]